MKNEENKNLSDSRIDFSDDIFKPAPPAPNKARAEKKQKEYKKRQKRMYALVAVIVLLGVFIAICASWAIKDIFGLNKTEDKVELTIPEGASISGIADILEENGVVNNSFLFKAYAKFFARDFAPNFGSYELDRNSSYKLIAERLEEASARTDVVTLTIVEGMTQREIGELLEENGVCKKDDFDKVLEEGDFSYNFMENMSTNPLIFRKFEGYLFPDTYDFFLNEDPKSVADKFLSNFDSKITYPMYMLMEERKMNLGDVISLASIIQAEAGGSSELYNVSSALHNRLQNPDIFPSLECDVSIFYLRDDVEPYLENPDDKEHDILYNSYNSYEKKGIPIGPICNPGLEAIDACLNPSKTPYFFFVTDNSGKFYYAETARQHSRNIQITKQINQALASKKN